MKNRILGLYRRYREQVNYIFFGGLTTLVNIVGYALLRKLGVPIVRYPGGNFVSERPRNLDGDRGFDPVCVFHQSPLGV